MNLKSGTRLGPYEIVAPVGVGGMGEVYRARDTRLDRSVAIKVLPAEVAHDAKFRIEAGLSAGTRREISGHGLMLYTIQYPCVSD